MWHTNSKRANSTSNHGTGMVYHQFHLAVKFEKNWPSVLYSSSIDIEINLTFELKSLTDDCMEPKWYKQDCFFKHRRPASETLIDGFANLRIADQMAIRKLLGFSKSESS